MAQVPFSSAPTFPGLYFSVDKEHVTGVYRNVGDIIVIRVIGTVEARPPVGAAPVRSGPERGRRSVNRLKGGINPARGGFPVKVAFRYGGGVPPGQENGWRRHPFRNLPGFHQCFLAGREGIEKGRIFLDA